MALTLLLGGCQVGYYAHLLRGELDLLSRRQSIEALLAEPDTDAALKPRLALALDARRFATRDLRLPDNASYTQYADLGRPYALWNVYASPEFSLEGHEWCYPLMGCMAYRGYYDRERAEAEVARLREAGLDVTIAGVPAYSTLGWFDDPLLNTLMRGPEEWLAGTVFHELAHQQLFLKGDTAFNESFASFVEEEGLRRFLAGRPVLAASAKGRRRHEQRFIELVLDARQRLERLYARDLPLEEMRAAKQAEFERLRARYREQRPSWGTSAYDAWFAQDLNNAQLLPFGLYFEWVPAFGVLFADGNGDWDAFYRAAEALSELPQAERRARLEALARRA